MGRPGPAHVGEQFDRVLVVGDDDVVTKGVHPPRRRDRTEVRMELADQRQVVDGEADDAVAQQITVRGRSPVVVGAVADAGSVDWSVNTSLDGKQDRGLREDRLLTVLDPRCSRGPVGRVVHVHRADHDRGARRRRGVFDLFRFSMADGQRLLAENSPLAGLARGDDLGCMRRVGAAHHDDVDALDHR